MNNWKDVEEIKRVKYRYLRSIDMGDIKALEDIFASKASCAFYGGSYTHVYNTREDMFAFLRSSFHNKSLSRHTCHHPEIDMINESQAKGSWYLEDYFENHIHGVIVQGTALYDDRYVKEGGQWKIAHTGYKRIFEQISPLPKNVQITAHYLGEHAPDPQ